MDPSSSSSRLRTYELPKPEAGLAEWTSKIKALQRQVDADEEAEQRRLEEEIASFRAARLRRSQGIGNGHSAMTLDSSKSDDSILASATSPPKVELPDPMLDRQKTYDEPSPLPSMKPTVKPSYGSSPSLADRSKPIMPTATATPSEPTKSEPMSLAQFMGGRATGPKLNRHMPQQDAHDPTQFVQRSSMKVDAPHPVFGRGGVALPGMVSKPRDAAKVSVSAASMASTAGETFVAERDRRLSTPGLGVQPVPQRNEPVERPPIATPNIRSRTLSTPTGRVSPTKPSESSRQSRQSYTPYTPSYAPKSPVTTSFVPTHSLPPPKSKASPQPMTPPPQPQRPVSTTSTVSPSSSMNASPSLARPVLPSAKSKPSQYSPVIGASASPSPAFLKPPMQKEPTPSISRLQGRGFVQSIVQASSQIEARNPSPPTTAEKPRPANGGKRASVLDRWQPSLPSVTNSPPPVISPKPVPLRKSNTIDPSMSTPTKVDTPIKGLRSVPSLPSMVQRNTKTPEPRPIESMPPVNTPGLGSATTMVVYKEESPVVDELGVRRRSLGSPSPAPTPTPVKTPGNLKKEYTSGSSVLPAASGKPLAHPTRDRAKLPRRHKGTAARVSDSVHRSTPESIPSTSTSASTTISSSPLPQASKTPASNPPSLSPIPSHKIITPMAPPLDVSSRPSSDHSQQYTPFQPKGMVGAKALPGLAALGRALPTPPSEPRQPAPTPTPSAPARVSPEPRVSPSSSTAERAPTPVKHTRIPSTGNRPTVMDVAQVFNEHSPAPLATSPVDVKPATEESKPPPSTPQVAVATPRHSINLPPASAEKRKSSYERYSGIAMPPLTEEATPTSTPVGTLARNVDVKTMEPVQSLAATAPVEISIARSHEPLPDIDLSIFERQKPTTTANDIQTISIDVLSISGNSTNAVTKDPHIFYDSEVLCVVHRFKVKATGLVSSVVWGWQGKRGHLAEKEMNKLEELARRYGTSLVILHQHRETAEFVKVLGGLLITRQGNRTHWSADNTCMHLARTSAGVVFIDEYDLSIKNLCSGFSYCLSILNTIYVWHGCGSLPAERAAIVRYAHSLSGDAGSVQELAEGQSDDDEMFWMILGSDDYAKADYWRWRSNFKHPDPQVWRVDSRSAKASLERISHILDEPSPQDCVYLVDCIWEFFVVVGMKARGHQLDIRLAMHVAHELSTSCAKSRPFVPPVHALILPTRIPCDLLLGLRGIEESWMNDNEVPDHMNLLPYENALQDLSTNTFELKVLKDHSMLPLGVDSSDLP